MGEKNILKILRVILSIVIVVLASFMLITQNFEFMPYLMLVLGISTLITGIVEIQKDKGNENRIRSVQLSCKSICHNFTVII